MKATTFFRAAVLVPLVVPVLLLPVVEHFLVAAALLVGLAFGGVQYSLFAVFLWRRIGVLHDARRIFPFMLIAPLLFVPIQFSGWLLWSAVRGAPIGEASYVFAPLLPFAAYVLLLGYSFVGLVTLAYGMFRSVGVIAPTVKRVGVYPSAEA